MNYTEKHKEYYQKNREKIATRKKEYYQKNREKILARARGHYQKNREKINEMPMPTS